MPSSTAPMSCSRETCFSAFSCRRAPTKSRLMIASCTAATPGTAGPKKRRGGHPRHGAAVQLGAVYTRMGGRPPGARAWAEREPRVLARSGGAAHRRRIALFDVVLEELDELGD